MCDAAVAAVAGSVKFTVVIVIVIVHATRVIHNVIISAAATLLHSSWVLLQLLFCPSLMLSPLNLVLLGLYVVLSLLLL